MRRFKYKNKYNYKIAFIIIILIFVYTLFINISNISLVNDYAEVSTYLLKESNSYIKSDFNPIEKILKKLININNLFSSKLNEIPNVKVLSFLISDKPKVYIYSTHDSEKYMDNAASVREVAIIMKQKLEELGIPTLVEEEKVTPYLDTSYSAFYQAYEISRKYLTSTLDAYPDLELIIDLHRDSADREDSYIEIDGKKYAKILFVQGVRYDRYEENLKLVTSISDKINTCYPGISKGIILKNKSYQHDNYNQDLSPYAMLLELGSNNNTMEEINNTIDVLVPILKEVMNEKENI